MKKFFKNKKGFTLTELLVVIFVISVISAIALPQYIKVLKKARNQEAIFNLRVLKRAQESYFLLNGSYTTNLNALDVDLNTRLFKIYCIREEWFDCYVEHKNGERPYFEAAENTLFCRGTRDDCKDFSTRGWTSGNSEFYTGTYWIIDSNM